MTNLKTNTARAALIALIAAAPMAAFAQVESTSPSVAVDENPREYAEPDTPSVADPGESMIDTLRATEQGEDADVVEDVDGSMIKIGPRDNG